MAITLSGSDTAIPGPPLSSRLTTPQVWGIVLLAPYVLVFLAFVVYPVGYGLWLARSGATNRGPCRRHTLEMSSDSVSW